MATNAGGGGGGGGEGTAAPISHDGRAYQLQIYPRLAAHPSTCCNLRSVERPVCLCFFNQKKKKKTPICIDIYQYFQQSAEGCDCGISHFRRCHSSGAGPRPSVRPGRGERMRRRRMGAGGCGPACAEVLTVATKSPRATPTKPWLLLFTTGKDHNKPCYILLSDGEREQTRKGQSSFLSFFFFPPLVAIFSG